MKNVRNAEISPRVHTGSVWSNPRPTLTFHKLGLNYTKGNPVITINSTAKELFVPKKTFLHFVVCHISVLFESSVKNKGLFCLNLNRDLELMKKWQEA